MILPPDRSHIDTEQRNSRCDDLHSLSVQQCVHRLVEEDKAVHRAMQQAEEGISRFIEAASPGFCQGGRLVYFGAGTSGRLGVLDASEAPPTFQVERGRVVGIIAGGDSSLRTSSEGKEDEPDGAIDELEQLQLQPNDTLVGIAAGGTTPYVRGGLEWASSLPHPPLTAMISCSTVEPPRGVAHMIILSTGPEVLTGSTRMKAGTATKLALNTISTTLMIQEGRVYRNLMIDLKASNAKLRDRAARIYSQLTGATRQEAFLQLKQADGELKTALVVHHKNVSLQKARSLLTKHSVAELLE
jgi:N-acetylmuramic acid 6-phosphate etherase